MGWGQVNLYSFSSTAGTYTPITGGTVVRSGNALDSGGATVTLPTAFPFNGASITSLRVNDDAYLALGVTSFSNSTAPIASSNAATGIIAALACDLMDANAVGTTPEIRWEQIGNEIIFQWNDFARYTTSTSAEIFDFQIRLNTSNGQIVIVYSNFSTVNTTSSLVPQVGLRGSTTTDFNARRLTTTVPTATPSWSNTAAATSTGHNVRLTSTSPAAFPSTGLTYTWTPPVPCSGSPTAGTISTANQYLCSGATVPNLVNTGFSSGVTGITFQWQQSTDDSNWINVTTGTGATTAIYTPPAFAGTTIYYRCNVTCANGGGAAATPSVSINPPANPATQVTNAVASSISYTGFTTTWVNGNGNRRVVYVSDTAIVDPSNSTGAAAPTVNTVYAGSGQQIVYDDTGTTVTVTGLTLGTTYYVKVFEYTRCGTTTFDNYYNTTAGTNAISVTTSSISPTPWSEGFATGVATFPNWQTTSGAAVGSTAALDPALSSNYWYVNLYGTRVTAAVTTPIIGSIPSNYRFVVKYKLANYSSPYAPPASGSGDFIVAISTDNGTSYTNVETIANNAVAGWQEYVLNLSAYAGQNIRIRLTGNRTSGDYYLAFDNYSVEAIPSCLPPNTLVLSSITNNSASLSWTAPASAPGSGYDVYYSTTNTAPLAGTTPSANVPSGTTYAYSGLTASTTYYSWVRSNCGSGDVSTWVASASFTTQCNPVSVPYSQDFESVTIPALPICTSIENAGTGNNWKTVNSFTKCLNYSYNGTNAANAWFYTAGINLTAGTSYRISYNYTGTGVGFPENLKVAYGVSASSASMTTVLATHTNIVNDNFPGVISTVDFTPSTTGVYYFGFNAFSDADMNQLYVDNISIILTPNTWTGTTSNSWNTASNWSLTRVPTATDDVLISSNGSNAPIMDVDVTIPVGKSLTLTGGELTIAPGKVLTIAGTANFGGRPVTFKSNATGTAMLGPLTTGTLTGANSVTVERFIPSGKRAFRLLSPAVTTTNFISGNWQGQTHITGGLGTTGLGFDATETNNPSMYTYNNNALSGSGWTPILNTNATNLTAGVGYRMLVRGDRTATNITTATTDNMNAAITLSATGTLKTGTVILNASSTPAINNTTNTVTNGYSLVGNPYQSAVDWNAVTKSGIEATYWAWDPNMGTSTQRGRYVSFNGLTNNYLDTPASQVGRYIQPGQAFFVKNTGSSAGTLTFEEAHKATTSANVFRTANTPTFGVALYDPNELAIGGYPIDATKAVFSSDYSNELGLGDATKLEAAGENIAWFRNNTKLAIDAAAPVTTSDELVMKTIRLGANKNYTFKIQTTNFDTALTPYLVDTFLNTQTEISTSQAYLASFATTSNVASYSENRFKIVFQNAVLSTDTFASQVGLYPNPSKGNGFYLQLPSSAQATVKLYNTIGQEIGITN
ncbi:choice-of-anchor J domain-containing protein, partial [Flavobacterium sp.]|uniref:choice-of-anchor J domain-containing protein n=1 Tax=Flavobacterium sp. TaxID=239 RepID=UPI0037BF6925